KVDEIDFRRSANEEDLLGLLLLRTVLITDMDISKETYPQVGSPSRIPSHVVRGKQACVDHLEGVPKTLFPQTPPQKIYASSRPASKAIFINDLNTTMRVWSIEGRAVAKNSMQTYSNDNGNGCFFGFDFVDGRGGEIRVSCFNEIAEKFYGTIENEQTYTISNGRIGKAKEKFNNLNSTLEIFLSAASIVRPLHVNDQIIPLHHFHFVPIKDIPGRPAGSFVDILGVVLVISPRSTIRRRDQTETFKRTVQVEDMSGFSVSITLWGQHSTVLGEELEEFLSIPQKPVLALKTARISSFNGTSLDTISTTKWFVNPMIPESLPLQEWIASDAFNVLAPSITNRVLGPPSALSSPATIAQVLQMGNTDKNEWATITAKITDISLDNFYYLACPLVKNGTQCRKKVQELENGSWFCGKCNIPIQKCDYKYALRVTLQDSTGELQSVTAFDETAENIMGVKAEDLQFLSIDDGATTEIADQVIVHEYQFTLSIKLETYREKKQFKCVIIKSHKLEAAASLP
ncbi:hypothetical protein KI387_015219, partial [Taxus chinensis]